MKKILIPLILAFTLLPITTMADSSSKKVKVEHTSGVEQKYDAKKKDYKLDSDHDKKGHDMKEDRSKGEMGKDMKDEHSQNKPKITKDMDKKMKK